MERNETKEIFERMAAQYDTEERVQSAKRIADEIRAHIGPRTECSALDYGCGTGLVGLNLTDLFQSMLFVDVSQQMIEQVRRKIEAAQIPSATTLCCDFCSEDPPPLQVDYILLSQTLLHIPDTTLIFSRLFPLLNAGGHLVIVDFDKADHIVTDKIHNGFAQAELIELAKRTGFASARARTFYRGQRILMNQDASLFLFDAEK